MIGTVAKIIAVTLLLTVVVGSYASSYLYLVESTFDTELKMVAKYKVGGKVSETIYFPAYQVDRYLRPDFWDAGCLRR